MDVSLVIPVRNEQDNVLILYDEIRSSLDRTTTKWEALFVDDGSSDDSFARLKEISQREYRVKVIRLRRNYGQTAALQAGLHAAVGDVVVTLDGDLQNDPRDIPMLLAKIGEGYDLVHGWRKQRHDALLTRKIPSKLANWFIARVTRFPIRDLGCTLKAMRREIAQDLELYGEMHRFIPILAHWRGARCCEVVTGHRPRRFGRTNYGLSRTLRVLLDLITVKYFLDYAASPMKLFGGLGMMCTALGGASLLGTLGMKLLYRVDMTGNPLLLLSAFAVMIGIQFFSLGLLGEVAARIYFGTRGKQHYTIRETLNLVSDPANPTWQRAA